MPNYYNYTKLHPKYKKVYVTVFEKTRHVGSTRKWLQTFAVYRGRLLVSYQGEISLHFVLTQLVYTAAVYRPRC